ncbi:MAG: hypothetical protein ABI239_11125 [Aquihabitans sp.]
MTRAIAMVLVANGVGVMVLTLGRPVPLPCAEDGGGVRNLLIGRFIERSQRFRRAGAIVALILLVAYSTVGDSMNGQAAGANADLLMVAAIGLAGSIVGSIVAEAFRVRRRGPRTASLDVRGPDSYRDRVAGQRELVLLVLAAAGVAGALVTGAELQPVIALGVAVVLLALVRRWAVRRIALRPRPVVPADVAAADDEVRRMATSAGVSRPIVTLGALAVSSQWFTVVAADVDLSESVTAISIVSTIAWIGAIVLFLTACEWWWTNRSFGLILQAAGGPPSRLPWRFAIVGALIVMMVILVLARGLG